MARTKETKHQDYFEAILQLRNCDKEVQKFVKNQIEKNKINIAKTKKLKTGIDYYLSNKAFARSLGNKLQHKYNGQLLTTASLFSEKKGKKLYRFTILFRQFHYKKGDLINYKGEKYQIKSVSKEIFLQHSKTGKKERVKYKEMSEIRTSEQ
jgi:NMD protein affecting ribosome stability and mRNA decay